MKTKNNPGQETRAANDHTYLSTVPSNKLNKKTKFFALLEYFSTGKKLHRFQAEKIGDHSLHSSISSLQQNHGLRFDREWVTVCNRFGGTTRVKSYWLTTPYRERAKAIVRRSLS